MSLSLTVLLQHHQGQVTVDRIATFLTSLGLVISKRQVLRLRAGHRDYVVNAEALTYMRARNLPACTRSRRRSGPPCRIFGASLLQTGTSPAR